MAMNVKIKKFLSKAWPWALITIGAIMASLGYVIFVLPMNMVEGGVTGIGIIAQRLTGLPIVGTTSILLTSIVFVFGIRILGKGFGARSIYAMILVNVLIDLFSIFKIAKVTNDMLLAAFYGGAIVGIGMGLIYFSGASTGGADAIAQILWRLKRIPLGRTMIIIDICVLGTATLLFIPIQQIMYSLIFIFIEIKAIDTVLDGIHANQRVLIITAEPDKIKDCIIDTLNRGLTIFKGTGGYTGDERFMLTTVIPRKNIPEVRRIIASIDVKAFVIIEDVNQVYGEGFETLPTQHSKKKIASGGQEPF
jgi:uncharacterized membrane-anchored protein YitT (DUF2179 family)